MKTIVSFFKPNGLFLAMGFVLFATMSTMQSCSPSFDQMGLDNITNIGGKLTDLMAKATEPYGKHEASVTKIMDDLTQAAAHASSQKQNKEIANSWNTLKNELAKPFFDRWKSAGVLNKEVVKESVGQVGKSLDAIKKAEMAKKK